MNRVTRIIILQIYLTVSLLFIECTGFVTMPKFSGISGTNSKLSSVPSLIVFDLDNTLWTPELYQLRKLERNNIEPVAHKDVQLFPAAKEIIETLKRDEKYSKTKFAVASRTKSVSWAHSLLKQFDLYDFFHFIEIFPGDKQKHFLNLKESSGIDFEDMVFFDDSRDGKYGNIVPVSRLGVLSCHCPNGMNKEHWNKSLEHYKNRSAQKSMKGVSAIVEWDGSIFEDSMPDPSARFTGVVRNIIHEKRFGFIRQGSKSNSDFFFHYSALVDNVQVEAGDEVTFSLAMNEKKGKMEAKNVQATKNANSQSQVEMRVFSMNMPFAALLANGYKTLESRNGTMFVPYPEGTKMLLHVGQRIYPDGDRHIEVMKSGGLDDNKILSLKALPEGFRNGCVIAIVEIGKTFETTLEERCDPEYQRKVAAFGQDSGMRATEIKRVQYLKRPIKVSGQGGVFKIKIDRDVIPDGWMD